MKKFLVLLLLSQSVGAAAPTHAQRVISLSPALTELIYALGLENKLVGVSDFSDYPKEAKEKPSVGLYNKPNLEKILDLHPDLVIVPIEGPEDLRIKLDQIHVPYVVVRMKQLDDVGATAVLVSTLLGNTKAGENFKTKFNNDMENLFKENKPANLNVLIEIQSQPLMAAGKNTFLDEIVTKCGGKNIIQREGYPSLSWESLLEKKIDVVLLADYFPTASEKEGALKQWAQFPPTKKARVTILDSDTTTRPGPRLLKGIQYICHFLSEGAHGQAH